MQAFSKARMLAERLGDRAQLFAAIRGESACRTISGDLRVAETLGLQCHVLGMELSHESGDSAFALEAHHQLWGINFYLGDYQASALHANRGIATYDYERHRHLAWGYAGHDPGVCCRAFSAQMLCMGGKPDQAIQRSRDAMSLAERDSHPFTMAQAQLSFSIVHLMRREPTEARRWAEKGVALCSEYVMSLLLGQARVYLGWALAGLGQLDEGIREMREGTAVIAGSGADMGMAYYLCALAGVCGERLPSEGLALLEQAFDTLAKTGSTYQLPELLRTKGELLLSLDPRTDDAESCFRRSLAVAHDQGTRSSELRAALQLARLYVDRKRHDEARDVLTPVYGGFEEGFDTPDLAEAKGLLQTLSHSTAQQ
jgi:predicted ATPase